MPETTLVAQPGRKTGSSSSRRLRALGQLPAVIYGHGMEPVAVSVDARELRSALTSASGANALLSMQVGDTTHLTMAKEIQHHPVRGTLLHADFVIVRRDEVVGTEVPIILVGESEAVHRERGIIEQQAFTLAIRALPGDIPNSVEVDISALVIGDAVRVGDLVLPPGVEADVEAEAMVVVAQPPQVADLGEEEEATDEAAAGEVEAPVADEGD